MTAPPSGPDASATSGLAPAIEAVLPALERFIREGTLAADSDAGWQRQLAESLPEHGIGAEAVLELLSDVIIPNGLRIGAPGFSGWVTTAPTIVPAVTAMTATLAGTQRFWDQPYHLLEEVALGWLKELFSIPPEHQGVFVSGGSVASLVGLGAARQWAGERLGLDVSRDGCGALPEPRIYASTEVHHVVHRAAGVLGMGRRAVVELPVDDAFRLDVAALRKRLRADRAAGCTAVAVVATTGTVNTGAVDPLPEIVEVCREEQVWLHVDGAYGLPGMLDPQVSDLFAGLGDADSIVFDPHKWLAVPIGCGAVFVRDRELLGRAFTMEPAEYLDAQPDPGAGANRSQFHDLGVPYFHFGVEQSAPSRGVQVWSVLKEIGVDGFRDRVRRHNDFARHLAELVEASEVLELLAPVTLSICCFRYVPPDRPGSEEALNELNREVVRCVQERGRCAPSGTELRGAFAIRPCYINPRSTLADVEALIEEVETCGAAVWERMRESSKV